jgi:hypothetical protein
MIINSDQFLCWGNPFKLLPTRATTNLGLTVVDVLEDPLAESDAPVFIEYPQLPRPTFCEALNNNCSTCIVSKICLWCSLTQICGSRFDFDTGELSRKCSFRVLPIPTL